MMEASDFTGQNDVENSRLSLKAYFHGDVVNQYGKERDIEELSVQVL
jgi:hypothetical protein